MKIQYLGHSCFSISNGKVNLLTDPFDGKSVGYNMPFVKADAVTVSHNHSDHNSLIGVEGNPVVFNEAGEFSFGNVSIKSFESFHDDANGSKRGKNLVFVAETEGVRICHLGDIGEMPQKSLINSLGRIDVLMIPVGGFYTISSASAVEYVSRIKPKICIPMHYAVENGTLPIAPVSEFTELYDDVVQMDGSALVVSDSLLSGIKDTKVIVLNRKK